MKKKTIWVLRWSLPVVCLLFALFFYTAIPGFSFSGLMSLGICGILLCYNFFTLLSPRFPKTVKWVRRIFCRWESPPPLCRIQWFLPMKTIRVPVACHQAWLG